MRVKKNSKEEIAEKEHLLPKFSAQTTEAEQIIQNLAKQLEAKDDAIRSLSLEVREKQETITKLSSQLSESEQIAQSLSSQLTIKDQSCELLSEKLSATEYELRRIKETPAWRLLSRYGRIKYRYLLPIYRALGLPPYSRKTGEKIQNNQPPGKDAAMQPSPSRQTEHSSSECVSTGKAVIAKTQISKHGDLFSGMSYHAGRCNICGTDTVFFYSSKALYRESLVCGECLTTSRYRSIARGILRGIFELTGIEAASLSDLNPVIENVYLRIYDTQVPFFSAVGSYPIPDLLSKCHWINTHTSSYQPQKAFGTELGKNTTNQNLEQLAFPDNSFDIVITSDVMEHVRLDHRAHLEIKRVLKPGGIYLFTVPHLRDRRETITRVAVIDPSDPTKDVFLMEKEYHGDANSRGGQALSYRAYGTELDEALRTLGFSVDYCNEDFPEIGIMNTELFYCRLAT